MNVSEIIHHAIADGVSVSLNGAGQVKITGDESAVQKWLPAISDNKAGIIAALSPPGDKAPEAEVSVSENQGRLCGKPSPIALAWLQEHRQALDDTGWTRAELYSRVKYKQGLVWLELWDQAFSMAYMHEDGCIEFECSRHGRDYFQTARPKRHEAKR